MSCYQIKLALGNHSERSVMLPEGLATKKTVALNAERSFVFGLLCDLPAIIESHPQNQVIIATKASNGNRSVSQLQVVLICI